MRGKLLSFQRETQREAYSHIIVKALRRVRDKGKSVGLYSSFEKNFHFFHFFHLSASSQKRSFNQKMFSLSTSLVARPTTTTVSLRKNTNTKVRFVFCALLTFSFLLSFLSARVVSRPARGPSSLIKTSSSSSKHPIL
jgi:hypothetical protein